MLISLSLIAIAFIWLLLETDFLRIRLPMGASKPVIKSLPAPIIEPVLLLDTAHDTPTEFETLEMPETSGEVNILCVRVS